MNAEAMSARIDLRSLASDAELQPTARSPEMAPALAGKRRKPVILPSFLNAFAELRQMKADIHPKYQGVVFQDVSSNFAFLTRSTMTSKETIKWEDGKEYPVIKVEISSQSHPFYTGKHKIVDSGGRVDKFRRRYGAAK
jgi:large subunit ribosomal protein L31